MATLRVPHVVPSPLQDSQALRKAFEGLDDKTVIWILGHRKARQIREIRNSYQKLYNETLIDSLKAKLWGDFRNAAVIWSYDPPERHAILARNVLTEKIMKDVRHLNVIIEIACAFPPFHLMEVRQAYCSMFSCSLEEDISSASISPILKKVLYCLVRSYRFDGENVDDGVANLEAKVLFDAATKKKLDDDSVMRILGTRNFFQLRETFKKYELKYGRSIRKDIASCRNGDLKTILLAVIGCVVSPEWHFAEVLKSSIVGIGTDEESLTRVIVTRAEVDMSKIRAQYDSAHTTPLVDDIAGDTSGTYKDFLLTLMGVKF